MQTTTLLLLFAAAIVALLLVFLQYYFKTKPKGKLFLMLVLLRFLAFFGFFILLINPKFSKNEFTLEKTNLVVLADNSSSMAKNSSQTVFILDKLNDDEEIAKRFSVNNYSFDSELEEATGSMSFEGKNTDIFKALSSVKDIFSDSKTAVILLTDGNQTLGTDYGFQGSALKFPIYPLVIGDTTKYEDVRLDQINVNKYAFLKNKYPLEVYASYDGASSVSSLLSITVNGRIAYRETLKFSDNERTKIISTLLDASTVGIKTISIRIQPLENERNTVNNLKEVAIEVIDEKTNVTIISNILHPDIGALIKSIESNEQRAVTLKNPQVKIDDLDETDVFILYQPDTDFKPVTDYIKQKKASSFIIGGNKTDWTFMNKIQSVIRIEDGFPNQEIVPLLNPSFSRFDISEVAMNDFPPLESDAGTVINVGDADVLATMKIRGREIGAPLILAQDETAGKKVFVLGENIWKWRMQSFRNDKNFENFDRFISKLILYLSNNSSKNRLNIDFERVYDGSGNSKITATYFDEAFVFDSNADLSLLVKNTETTFSKTIPMLLKNGFYEADLLGIPAGKYDFTVNVINQNRSKSGSFTILDFDVEQQLLTSDYRKLQRLANDTDGRLHFPSEIESLLLELKDSNRFTPTQKGTKNVVSLIDFKTLMALIAGFLALEWFIRKYNGLT